MKKPLIKFNKIFEYSNIRDNLNIGNYEDYSKFFENFYISEGLIKSQSQNITSSILQRMFPEMNIDCEKDGEIYLYNIYDKEKLLKDINNLGWNISSIFDMECEKENKWIKYDEDLFFSNRISDILIEPKYDELISSPNKINNFNNLYHVTLEKNMNKIKKIGLIPKSKNKLLSHPDRIYLFDNIKNAEEFKTYLEKSEKAKIIEIKNISDLLNKIWIYSDVNTKGFGYYTLSNIPKEYLNI